LANDLPLDVRIIKWSHFNNNGWSANRSLSYADMMERIQSDDADLFNDVDGGGDDDSSGYDGTSNVDKILLSSIQGLPPMKLL